MTRTGTASRSPATTAIPASGRWRRRRCTTSSTEGYREQPGQPRQPLGLRDLLRFRFAFLQQKGDHRERRRPGGLLEKLSDHVVGGERETAEPLGEGEMDGATAVQAAVDELGADDPGADVEIELEVVGFADVAEGFHDARLQRFGVQIRT